MPPSTAFNNGSPPLSVGNKDGSVMTLDSIKSTELATVDHGSGQLEVNFEKNVTVLYDSISNSNWEVALRTLKHNPEEARTWVVRYHENQNNGIMWRFLPLHSACARQPPTTVVSALLRAFGNAANCCDDQGMYPLHYACGNHASAEVIRALVDANPTAASMGDPNGMVPMHYMAQWGPSSVGAIEALIVASPGVKDLQDAQGYTPLEYAMDGDYPERDQMVDCLENNGPGGGGRGPMGGDDDGVSHATRSYEEEEEVIEPQIEAPLDRRQQKKSYPSHSRTASPSGAMSPNREATSTPVQQQLAYWSQKEKSPVSTQSQWNQNMNQSGSTARTSSSTPTQAQSDQQNTISAQPSWLTSANNAPVRSISKTRSSTPTSRLANSPRWNEPNDRNDRSEGHDRPTTAPVWNNNNNNNSPRTHFQTSVSRNRAESSRDMLPPRDDHNNYNGNSNSNGNGNGNNRDTPSSSVVKSLVKLRAEIVKLEAEAAYNEADMEERLLNQRESFQAQIDEVNTSINKADTETASVRADVLAKDEFTVYTEKSTTNAERDIKQMLEDNRMQDQVLQEKTRVYEQYKNKVDAMQSEARELSKSFKVMRQEQEHILANLTMVEEDIDNASRARKKKLQAMFDEEMKYSMENVEMGRVGNGGAGDSYGGLSVRQKIEEQKELMEKCDDILAECE